MVHEAVYGVTGNRVLRGTGVDGDFGISGVPDRKAAEIDQRNQHGELPGRPDEVTFEVPNGLGTREGWFFPGLRGAPTIILCHGYGSSRGELLTIVSTLQDHQFNVFVFD